MMERELELFRQEVDYTQNVMIFVIVTTIFFAMVVGIFVKDVRSRKEDFNEGDSELVVVMAVFLISAAIAISICTLNYINNQMVDGVEEILHQYN